MEFSGHTGMAQNGQDILCAAISAISQSAVLGLKQVVKCPVEFEKNDQRGYLCCTILTKDLKLLEQSQIVLRTALIALQDLLIGNEKYMKVEVCNEIY